MIEQAVILAAGKGTRISAGEDDRPKPLHTVAGLPLLKRTLLTLARGGVKRAFVVVGHKADVVRASVATDPDYARAGLRVELVDNPDFEKANGVSVLAVKDKVDGPFLLSMADHVYEPALPSLAAAADMTRADLYLCVDPRIGEIYDMDDATKVATDDGRIVNIGKTIPTFDCVNCGVFAVSPALFEALEEARAEKGDCSLSDGVRRLAQRGRARVLPIGDVFWQDVDTPGARERAERELFHRLRKTIDGPVARWVNRPLSLAVTRRIIDTRITPNQISLVAGALGLAGVAVAWCAQTWLGLILGAILLQVQSVLDGCDGEIARLKFQSSTAGEWLDNVIDDGLNVVYCAALGTAAARLQGGAWVAWAGWAGAVGFLLFSAVLYHQLATVHRSGNPFLMRWWFQRPGEDLRTTLARPGLVTRASAFFRAIGRRDVFILGFLVLIAVHLAQAAALWYALVGVMNGAMAVLHVAAGGVAGAKRASTTTTENATR